LKKRSKALLDPVPDLGLTREGKAGLDALLLFGNPEKKRGKKGQKIP